MRNYLIALCVLLFVGCTKADVESVSHENIDSPQFYAEFAENDTRTFVDEKVRLLWTEGDLLTIFTSTLNRKYQFDGETGDNSGTFSEIVTQQFGTGNSISANYAVYPYTANNKINNDEVITLTLPTTQQYAENSFGQNANTMVAVTSGPNDFFLPFKNLCGFLRLSLYGEDVTVKSITLKGNNSEKIAGKATVVAKCGKNPEMEISNDATESITLDCGEGVILGKTSAEATDFWFVVPPTTFSNGFTITITDTTGATMTKSTSKNYVVERNILKSMTVFEVEISDANTPPNNQIWYKTSDGNICNLSSKSGFGAKYLKNEYNPETGYWAISFDGDITNLPYHALNRDHYYIKITEVILPNKLTSIEGSAFVGCDLNEITIPESVTTFGECIFNNCSIGKFKGKFASSDNRCLIKDGKIIAFASKGIEAYTVPPAAHTIEKYAFYCATIKSIVIGNNIATINSYAFGSSALESIQWPSNVETIPYGAFSNCYNLQNITIPNTVNSIGQYAFSRCAKLKTLTLPSSISTIGNNAFDHASIITLNVEGNLPSANSYYPYLYYATIENIIIGDSAISIGDYALKNCLCTNFTIGEKVSVIGEYALPLNNSLVNIYSKATTPPQLAEQSKIDYAQNLINIYVPSESVDAYKAADGWKDYTDYIEGYDF